MKEKKPPATKSASRSTKGGRRKGPLKGTLLIIGGGEDKAGDSVILGRLAEYIGRSKLVISTVASLEPEAYYTAYEDCFARLGLTHLEQHYLNERSEANGNSVAMLDKAAGVFFTGGDQLRISSLIGDTVFEAGVRQLYERGGIVAGTSAGATAMGENMLIKGGASASCKIGDIHMAPGLGLLPNVIIDQHFSERGRVGRLLGAIALNPRILGIGIDEDTAIIVHNNTFEVLGSGAVYVVDGTLVTHTNIAEAQSDSMLSLFGLTIHVLSAGDTYDLHNRKPVSG